MGKWVPYLIIIWVKDDSSHTAILPISWNPFPKWFKTVLVRSHTVTHPMTLSQLLTEGAYLVTNNRILNRPLGRSLRSFARTAHSAHLLRSALLWYVRFAMIALFAHLLHSQARSLTSLTPSRTVKFIDMCSCCKRVQRPTSIERLGRGQWSAPCGLSSECGHSQFYRCFSAPKNYLNNVKNLLQFKSTAYKKAKHNFPMKSCQTCF